jgi:hypothetical protein
MRLRKQYDDGGEIASTILQQLGGANRLHAMTGAYNFINIGNGLTFKIKNQRANYIKITLTSMDLYNIEVGRIRGNTYKVVSEAQGLYSDQLKPFIEKATGMYLTLGRGFAKGGMISVNYDGEDLQYKVDTDEKSIEVDEATKKYLTDIVLVMDRDFRKLNNTYIFWYDEMSDEDIKELEEVLQTSLYKYADGGITKKYENKGLSGFKMTKGGKDWFIIKSVTDKMPYKVYVNSVDESNYIDSFKKKYGAIYYINNFYSERMDDGGEYAKGGELEEDDTFVMLFKGYGFVEKRGSYGTRKFYNIEHNAYIYYDPKYRSISGYVGGGEGNDEVIPYSVDGVLDFFIEHDISESEATPLANGGKVKKPFFRDRTVKLREPFNKGFEGLAKATGHESLTKMASGGNLWDEDLNVYTLVSSKEYFGSDTASDKRRWFRRNGRGLTRDQAKRMAQDYIDRYGKERVYIGNIRHYR